MAKPFRVGLAGLGTVGGGLVRLLQRRRDDLSERAGREIVIAAVSALSRNELGAGLEQAAFYDDPAALAASGEIDVFVEAMGGADGAAYAAARAALSRGLPLVTSNKAMIAAHGLELATMAESHGASLAFEAAVAGGIPVLKTLREGLVGNAVHRVSGILNGTCNYILTRMESDGLPFDVCLAEAQKLGYAEADPTFDIGGFDTAHKLAILASLAFGTKIDADAVSIEGIANITLADIAAADELGYRIKLLGVAERTEKGMEQRVHPTMVAKSEPLAQTMGVLNAVTIDGDAIGSLTLVGPGAGGDATASAVAADICDIARGEVALAFGRPVAALEEVERVPLQRHEGGYYARLAVVDRPGALATIAKRMGERDISLEAVMQKRRSKSAAGGDIVPVVLITHATTETSIREALSLAVADGVVKDTPQVIRIERD
jgi:homoserine dehydrogenase